MKKMVRPESAQWEIFEKVAPGEGMKIHRAGCRFLGKLESASSYNMDTCYQNFEVFTRTLGTLFDLSDSMRASLRNEETNVQRSTPLYQT